MASRTKVHVRFKQYLRGARTRRIRCGHLFAHMYVTRLTTGRDSHSKIQHTLSLATMVKRTSPDSDDESVQNASHASKRARTNGAEPSGRQNGNGTRNGKGKARQNADASDSDQQGDDDDDNAVKEEDEEEFEETYRARVLHDLEARRKVSGVCPFDAPP